MARTVQVNSFADVLSSLGHISAKRVLLVPPGMKATERHLLRLLERKERICELVDGFLVEKPPGFMESCVTAIITTAMLNAFDVQNLGLGLGATGALRLRPGLIRIPDACFISWDRFPRRQFPEEPIPRVAPDLAAHVLRRENTAQEMQRRLREYFEVGTRLVWIVDPRARTVQTYTAPDECRTLAEHETLTAGDVLPRFRLSLKKLFTHVRRESS